MAHLTSGVLDQCMNLLTTKSGPEPGRHRIHEKQAPCRIEVACTRSGWMTEPLGQGSCFALCPRGQTEQRRQGVPLGIPQACRLFMGGEDHNGKDQIALVRHGGGSTPAGYIGFDHRADLGRGEIGDTGRQLGEGAPASLSGPRPSPSFLTRLSLTSIARRT
jgi:hypothetical protein